jgi:outer membrane protein assembly factor BamB
MRFLVLAVASLTFLPAASFGDNWPHWRGPDNDGISKETNLPTTWDAKTNIVWTLPMPGPGCSTPVVWGDRIFLTSEEGKDVVGLCVSTAGKILWKTPKLGSTQRKGPAGEGIGATASPNTDGKHVWFFVGSGILACYDLDGKEAWKFDVQQQYGKFSIQYGMHSTPVVYEDRLYLQLIHSGAALVVALDKATGKEIWKIKRESDGYAENEHSYASPVIWHKGDNAYLITHGNDYAIAHSLKDGAELWRATELNPKGRYNTTLRFVSSPVATPDLIVVPSAKRGAVVGVKPDASGIIKPGGAGEQWRIPKNTPDVASPLVYDGLVYLCYEANRDGVVLLCLDGKTGQQQYSAKLYSSQVRHRASPVYADGKIYILARDGGTMKVVKAGPKFELLATNTLPDEFPASPAIANGRIYLRGYKALYAIGEK